MTTCNVYRAQKTSRFASEMLLLRTTGAAAWRNLSHFFFSFTFVWIKYINTAEHSSRFTATPEYNTFVLYPPLSNPT